MRTILLLLLSALQRPDTFPSTFHHVLYILSVKPLCRTHSHLPLPTFSWPLSVYNDTCSSSTLCVLISNLINIFLRLDQLVVCTAVIEGCSLKKHTLPALSFGLSDSKPLDSLPNAVLISRSRQPLLLL